VRPHCHRDIRGGGLATSGGVAAAVATEKILEMSRDASLFVMVRDRIGRSPNR
jgi:hypothetical protein